MKKILIISSIPYSESNRGIDLITKSLNEMNHEVTHLTFPGQGIFKEEQKNLLAIGLKKSYIQYYNKIMENFPKRITQFFINQTIKQLKDFNFNDYDYIILESGKPIFLIDIIPEKIPIIYRQSDSIKLILSKNKLYQKYEDNIIDRSYKIIVVREIFEKFIKKYYKNRYDYKIKIIQNGFNIPDNFEDFNPYYTNNNLVYLGYTPIDFDTINYICLNRNFNIHVIGTGLSKKEIKKLNKNFKNFFHYGFMNSKEYNKYLKYADAAIVPYKKADYLEYIGLNSKYLNYMFFKLPIISYDVGQIQEFKNSEVFFVNNKKNFLKEIEKNKGKKINYSEINLLMYSKNMRIKEYKKYFNEII